MTKREMGPLHTGDTPREQRLAAAGRVAAGLLHEFRNVLGPIANMAFVLERVADDPARVRDLARKLAEQAKVRGRVAERLLDFIQQDAVRFPEGQIAELSAIAADVAAVLAPLCAAQQTRLNVETATSVNVAGDPVALRVAMLELAMNALDAVAPSGGAITLRVATEADRAIVQILDTGNRPEGVAETAFDPFISSKHEPDAGLGLSAAWAIVRRHGGDLAIGPSPDGGSQATLKVPLSLGDN